MIPKVSMFAWRLVHNIIPSVGNLRRRGIQIDDRCCICGEFGETVVHVMLKYRFCKEVWAMVYPKLNEIVNLNLEWGNIWHVIFQQIIKDDYVEIFLTTCWMLWNNRNKCFHDNYCLSATKIFSSVNSLISDFKQLNMTGDSAAECQRAAGRESQQWLPPSGGRLKINTDASFRQLTKEAVLAVVGRDATGKVCFCARSKKYGIQSPLQAELLAIRLGMEVALDNGFKAIHVETDSLLAVQEIDKGKNSSCEWGCVVVDICAAIHSCEVGVVSHVRRAFNSCAHNLAKLSGVNDIEGIWWGTFPPNFCNPDSLHD